MANNIIVKVGALQSSPALYGNAEGILVLCPLSSVPTIVNGGMYYNTTDVKGKICINGVWRNILTEGVLVGDYIQNQTAIVQSSAAYRISGAGTHETSGGGTLMTLFESSNTTTGTNILFKSNFSGLAEPSKRLGILSFRPGGSASVFELNMPNSAGTMGVPFAIDSGSSGPNTRITMNVPLTMWNGLAGTGQESVMGNMQFGIVPSTSGQLLGGLQGDIFYRVAGTNTTGIIFGTGTTVTANLIMRNGVVAINNTPLYLAQSASDFTGAANGGIFYQSGTNKFRGYVNSIWRNFAMEDSAVVTGRIIYVDTNAPLATDTRTNISKYSESTPFKTVSAAAAVAVLGDSIYVRPGTYSEITSINFTFSNLTFDGCVFTSTSTITWAGSFDRRNINIINFASVTFTTIGVGVFGFGMNFTGDGTGTLIAQVGSNASSPVISNLLQFTGFFTGTSCIIKNIETWTCTAMNTSLSASSPLIFENIRNINCSGSNNFMSWSGTGIFVYMKNCTLNCTGHFSDSGFNQATLTIETSTISAAAINATGNGDNQNLLIRNSTLILTSYVHNSTAGTGSVMKIYNSEIKVGTTFLFNNASGAKLITKDVLTNATDVIRVGGVLPTNQLNSNNTMNVTFL